MTEKQMEKEAMVNAAKTQAIEARLELAVLVSFAREVAYVDSAELNAIVEKAEVMVSELENFISGGVSVKL